MTPNPNRRLLGILWDVTPQGAATSRDPDAALRSVASAAWRYRRQVRHIEQANREAVNFSIRPAIATARYVETDAALVVTRRFSGPSPFLGNGRDLRTFARKGENI